MCPFHCGEASYTKCETLLHLCPGWMCTSHHNRVTLKHTKCWCLSSHLVHQCPHLGVASLEVANIQNVIIQFQKKEQNWVITARSPKTLYITVSSNGFLWISWEVPFNTVTKELYLTWCMLTSVKKHLHLRTGLRACVTIFLSVSWISKLTSPTLQNIVSYIYICMYVYASMYIHERQTISGRQW